MLLEQLKSNRDMIFNPLSFMKIDKRLRNFNSYQVSVGLVNHAANDQILSVIFNEVNSNINRQVVKEIGDTKKHDCLDVSEYGDLSYIDHSKINKIIDFILNNKRGYKNIITSGLTSTILQDCPLFNIQPRDTNMINSNGMLYCVGDISGINIWIDPYMKYSDHRIFLFDHVDVNVEDVDFTIIDEATFAPRLRVSHKLSINVSDSKILFLLSDKNSPDYQQYKSLLRDKKIDNILEDEGKN